MKLKKYTTYILDTSVLLHDVQFWLSRLGFSIEPAVLRAVLNDQFTWMHSLGFLPERMIPGQARVVYAMDLKCIQPSGKYGYWRHDALAQVPKKRKKRNPETGEMQQTFINYKDGREPNPADRTSDDRVRQNAYWVKARALEDYAVVKKAWYDFARRNKLEVYEAAGYEADDVAAAYTVLHPDEDILLCTIDQDWIGLVNPSVAWYDIKGHQKPRLIDVQTVHQWAENKGYELTLASDIWAIKSAEGDKSDSLPRNTPIEYISLLEPPVEHRLWTDNRLGINAGRFLRNLPDYRIPEENLNQSFLENSEGIRCQLSTFYDMIRG